VLFSYEERKWRPRWFSLICLPFAHHADRRKLSIWKWTKRTKQTCPSMLMTSSKRFSKCAGHVTTWCRTVAKPKEISTGLLSPNI
jgi:hypothetical protein